VLAQLLASKGPSKKWVVGTAVGVYAVSGQPLVLIAVPAGIIAVMATSAAPTTAMTIGIGDSGGRTDKREGQGGTDKAFHGINLQMHARGRGWRYLRLKDGHIVEEENDAGRLNRM